MVVWSLTGSPGHDVHDNNDVVDVDGDDDGDDDDDDIYVVASSSPPMQVMEFLLESKVSPEQTKHLCVTCSSSKSYRCLGTWVCSDICMKIVSLSSSIEIFSY